MPYNQSLAERVRHLLPKQRGFTEKKMFGGVGFLLNDNMCVGIWKNLLIVRLGVDAAEAAMEQPDVVPFDITGTAMKGWAMVEPDGLERDEQLHGWIEKAEEFVRTLPKKSARPKKTTRQSRAKRVAATRRGQTGESKRGK
jgi:TfoX/Sxy family transcriptional regulator of competence genes